MESSDEEFIIDIQPEPSADSSNDREQGHRDNDDSQLNQKTGRLIFRETVGADVRMITENCDVVDINTDQDALKMLSAGDKMAGTHPVVSMTWACLTKSPHSFCQIVLHAGSKTAIADIIHGLVANNYRRLRGLTQKIHSDYRVRVKFVQDNPFGFGLAHESTVSLDEVGRMIEDLERDVQIVLSACANRDISMELSLHLSDSGETAYYECNTEVDDTPVPIPPTKQAGSDVIPAIANTADNVDETGCTNETASRSTVVNSLDDNDGETERKFDVIEDNLRAQRSVIEAKFEEQRAQNEEINTTLKTLMSFVQQKITTKQSEQGATESSHPTGCSDLATGSVTHQASTSQGSQSDSGQRTENIVVMSSVGPMKVFESQMEPDLDTQSGQNQKHQEDTHQDNIAHHPMVPENPEKMEGPWNPEDNVYDFLLNRAAPLANSGKPEKQPKPSSDPDSKRSQEMLMSSQGAAGGYRLDPKLIALTQGGGIKSQTHECKAVASGNSRPQPQQQQQYRPPHISGHQRQQAQHFLKMIGVHGSSPEVQRLQKTVELAMTNEIPMPPKSKALNTILCLDTSSSMGHNGLKEMKDIAFAFIDALDDIAAKHEIEENIAVVTFGGPSKIIHHLSNDYTSIRDRIGKLTLGGRSPLFEALLVCLCAIHGRGGALCISGVHRLQPRVIIITDGKASDESEECAGDVYNVDDNVKLRIIQLMQNFKDKDNQTLFPRPLVWIPVGNANTTFLQSLADVGKGLYVEGGLSVVPRLSQYQRIQEAVGKVFVCFQREIGTETGDIYQDIETIMGALVGDMEQEYKVEVIDTVMAKLEGKEGCGNVDQGADGFDNIVEVDGLPPLGTRVTRGPDWHWGNQDTEGPGTIINHCKGKGRIEEGKHLLFVQWDNGTKNRYRYGLEYDVWPAPDQPRLTASDMLIDVGCEVTRGLDWEDEYGCQDGGEGCVGVVIRKNDQGMVKVRWKQNCYIGAYRYGADGKLDLCVRDPGDILKELTQTDQGKLPTDMEERTQVYVQHMGTGVWYWKDDRKQWQKYTEDHQKKLEDQFRKRPNGSCIIQRSGKSYRVLFMDMCEKDLSNESRRDVERTCVDEK